MYSEPGHGTTFSVYLPCSAPDNVVAAAGTLLAEPAAAGDAATILLVEDEPGVRHLARRILVRRGYDVIVAADGDEAERVFVARAAAINLVVTDVIPGCGGPELVARLQRRRPGLRVLYMSGYVEQADAHKAGIDRGMPFLEKPFTAAGFARHVREALDR